VPFVIFVVQKALREEDAQTIEPARALAAEAAQLERRISDLVNEDYGLTAEEVACDVANRPAPHAARARARQVRNGSCGSVAC